MKIDSPTDVAAQDQDQAADVDRLGDEITVLSALSPPPPRDFSP